MQVTPNEWAHLNTEALMEAFREEFRPTPKRPLPLDITDYERPTALEILKDFHIVMTGVVTPWDSAKDLIMRLRPPNQKCSDQGTLPVNKLMSSRKGQGLSNEGSSKIIQIWLLSFGDSTMNFINKLEV